MPAGPPACAQRPGRGPVKTPSWASTLLNHTQAGRWLGPLCPRVTTFLVTRKPLEVQKEPSGHTRVKWGATYRASSCQTSSGPAHACPGVKRHHRAGPSCRLPSVCSPLRGAQEAAASPRPPPCPPLLELGGWVWDTLPFLFLITFRSHRKGGRGPGPSSQQPLPDGQARLPADSFLEKPTHSAREGGHART